MTKLLVALILILHMFLLITFWAYKQKHFQFGLVLLNSRNLVDKEYVCIFQPCTAFTGYRDEYRERQRDTGINLSIKVHNCYFIALVIACHFQL